MSCQNQHCNKENYWLTNQRVTTQKNIPHGDLTPEHRNRLFVSK